MQAEEEEEEEEDGRKAAKEEEAEEEEGEAEEREQWRARAGQWEGLVNPQPSALNLQRRNHEPLDPHPPTLRWIIHNCVGVAGFGYRI